jgi:hypothetical protein
MNDKDNKLIALFMGLEEDGVDGYLVDMDKDYGYQIVHESCLLYDSSWDWLMPVVRQVLTSIDIDWIHYDDDELKFNVLDCDISGVHKEVVEFIKTYNNGKRI